MSYGSPICGYLGEDEGATICQLPAGWGTNHPGIGQCRNHGGNTKRANNDARKLMIREAAKEACTKLAIAFDDVTPEKALQDELNLSYAMVQWYTSHTDEDSAMWPVWQDLWMNERRHLIQVTKMMLDAGIAERQVKVMEEQAATLAAVIRAILDRLELTEDQLRRAPQIVREVIVSAPQAIEVASR